MKKKIIFKGAATALVTPFDALGEIDFTALGELIERQISEGIDALVICGTTGESATLTDTERRRCISFAVEKAEGRVPIIAGTGSNNAEYAKELVTIYEWYPYNMRVWPRYTQAHRFPPVPAEKQHFLPWEYPSQYCHPSKNHPFP